MKVENTVIKNLFRYSGGLAALFLIFSAKAVAQKTPDTEKIRVNVQFLREEDDFLVFRAAVIPSSEKRTILKIIDASKNVLYSEVIVIPDYSRIFKFPKKDEGQIEFLITGGKEYFSKSFTVTARTEELYVVNENN